MSDAVRARWCLAIRSLAPWSLLLLVGISLAMPSGAVSSSVGAAGFLSCLALMAAADAVSGDASRPAGPDALPEDAQALLPSGGEHHRARHVQGALAVLGLDRNELNGLSQRSAIDRRLVAVATKSGWIVIGLSLCFLWVNTVADFASLVR